MKSPAPLNRPLSELTPLLTSAEEYLPLVYEELRRLAAIHLARERPGQTLQATALVHEVYLRLAGDRPFDNPGHFFAAAATAMRRILVEVARRKSCSKHAYVRETVELDGLEIRMPAEEVVALDEALTLLEEVDPIKARLVTLRFFAGMSVEQAAGLLGISRVTAYRYWTFARAWLHQKVFDSSTGSAEAEENRLPNGAQ